MTLYLILFLNETFLVTFYSTETPSVNKDERITNNDELADLQKEAKLLALMIGNDRV